MWNFIQKQYTEFGLFLLRFFSGLGIMMHGQRKLFVGGMDGFTENVANLGFPIPGLFAWVAALSEFLGGVLLALGLGTRIAALFIAGTMIVAAFISSAGASFFAREKALLYLTVMVTFMFTRGGRYSLDYYIHQWKETLKTEIQE